MAPDIMVVNTHCGIGGHRQSYSILFKKVVPTMTLEDLLEQIKDETFASILLADQNLVRQMMVEVTVITHGLTVTQRRVLFEILYRFYVLVERLSKET